MKRLILTAVVGLLAVNGFAQGRIDVGNNFGATVFRAAVYAPDTSNPSLSVSGASGSPNFPTGTTTYTGARLLGTGFTFGFFASTSGITTDANSLTQIGALTFGTTAGSAGFVTLTTMTVDGVTAGNATSYQIRAWDNLGGTLTTWAQANAAWQAGQIAAGMSGLVNSGALGGTTSGGAIVPNPGTTDWTSFNIYLVPEPSTFVLAGLGAAALLIFRRRK